MIAYFSAYRRLPAEVVRGEGMYLFDARRTAGPTSIFWEGLRSTLWVTATGICRRLMLGCGLAFPGKPIAEEMLRRGFIINCTHQSVLRFLPPPIVQKEQVDELRAALEEVLAGYQP